MAIHLQTGIEKDVCPVQQDRRPFALCSPAGAGGYNKSSPGAGLCGTGFICCTQAAPTGGGWVQNPAPVPGCVGLALAAAPEPPPPGAGGYKKTQPWGRVVWGWPPLLHPSRPHRGRVGTKTHSPAASLCGTGCGAAAQKENDEEKKEKRMKTGSQDKVRRTGRTVLPLP